MFICSFEFGFDLIVSGVNKSKMLKSFFQKHKIVAKISSNTKVCSFVLRQNPRNFFSYSSHRSPSEHRGIFSETSDIKDNCLIETAYEYEDEKDSEDFENTKSLEILVEEQMCNLNQYTKNLISYIKQPHSLKAIVEDISNKEIEDIIKDLAEAFKDVDNMIKDKIFSDDSIDLNKFLNIFRAECVRRLKINNVSEDKFISLSNEHFLDVLKLGDYWRCLEKRKSKNSFLFFLVNNIGDTETGRSIQRFKHFTKDGFVTYCRLVRHTTILPTFHSYYVLIKFLDLLEQMNQDDVGEVCSTIYYHSFHLACEHPVNILLKTKLIDYLKDNFSSITSRNLWKISTVLSPRFDYIFPLSLTPNIKEIQNLVASDHHRFYIKSLITILNVGNISHVGTGEGTDRSLVDCIVKRLLDNPEEVLELNSKEIAILALAIHFKKDSPAGRYLLVKLVPRLCDQLKINEGLNCKSILLTTLQMAHFGLYETHLLEDLFQCPSISKVTGDGVRKMAKNLVYVGGYNNQSGLAKSAGDLLQLQGMVQMEFPSYSGPKIDLMDFEKKWISMRGQTPLEILKERKEMFSGQFNGHVPGK